MARRLARRAPAKADTSTTKCVLFTSTKGASSVNQARSACAISASIERKGRSWRAVKIKRVIGSCAGPITACRTSGVAVLMLIFIGRARGPGIRVMCSMKLAEKGRPTACMGLGSK